jgi:hypothetical protein
MYPSCSGTTCSSAFRIFSCITSRTTLCTPQQQQHLTNARPRVSPVLAVVLLLCRPALQALAAA